ncbi:MAG: nucleotide exchange factor GrpE [Chthoniobacter sp.]|nr:nucleotide exchange factor GrpE [Chthoniobacter sp.]
MPDHDQIQDIDFDSQLRGLFQEAEKQIEDHHAATRPVLERTARGEEVSRGGASLPQMLRPILLGIQAAARTAGENTLMLQKIGDRLDLRTETASAVAADSGAGGADLVTNLRTLLEQKNGVNQKMFAALHEELKGYKDGFLLETVHKPIIRDLISLHDDVSKIHRQMQQTVLEVAEVSGGMFSEFFERLKTVATNIEHNCGFLIEVLARLEVNVLPEGRGKLDMVTQRAMKVEAAESPEEDGEVARSLKPGFMWKGRVFRPEEVVIKKWKDGAVAAVPALAAQL